jgi:ATP sulfurylase
MLSALQGMFIGGKSAGSSTSRRAATIMSANAGDFPIENLVGQKVSKSLVQEMTAAEREEFNKLPFIELGDLEMVNYLHTIAEGWAFPLTRFMNEAELLESMHMNTVTDAEGKKHILSVPITLDITAEQKAALEGQTKVAIRCS